MVCDADEPDHADSHHPEWERSHDEYDDDDESFGEDEADEDGKEDPSTFWSELREAWQQHMLAILIAVVAASITHWYTHTPPMDQSMGKQSTSPQPLPVPHASPVMAPTIFLGKHAHLSHYERVSNITFCSRLEDQSSKSLQIFDFNVPKRLIPALALHIAADELEDDNYSLVLSPEFDAETALEDNLMYQCLLTQSSRSQQSFIKGLSYYYPKPQFSELYPDHQARSAVSVKQSAPKLTPTQLSFTGFGVKVVNLSPEPVLLFWDGPKQQLIGELGPYEALGTAATKAGQSFSVTPVHDPDHHMDRWVATSDDPIHYFQPDGVAHDHKKMSIQLLNREYERHYLIQTGRQWLAQFPRPLPVHDMWTATFFGQKHNLVTRKKNYKLEVVSVTPRVFSIDGFLSEEECDALVALARAEGLQPSTLQAGRSAHQSRDRSTRSSSNTWLTRDAANVTDAVYQRAARLLKMDESLLQKPLIGDHYHEHQHSLAESLQVVRYRKEEEYKAHHDFTYPPAFHLHQPTRFATILFYLNDDFEGGQTVFPRALNAQFHDGITVEPKKGKAVLFYNMLPDGNMDELSMHASKPVESGEKFLANLWVWGKIWVSFWLLCCFETASC